MPSGGLGTNTLDIWNVTAKAQALQRSLAVFFANEWGATALEERTHMLTMLEDDECARLAVERRTA
jgi:hypothetical protein